MSSRSSSSRRSTTARCARCACPAEDDRHRPHAALPPRQLRPRRDGAARRGRAATSRRSSASRTIPTRPARACSTRCCACRSSWCVTESFAPSDRQTARERMDLALRRLKSADEDSAGRARRDARRPRRARRRRGRLRRPPPDRAGARRRPCRARRRAPPTAAAALADTGAIAVREDINLEPAFWGQFPGNEAYLVRRALISTANIASFGTLHSFALGQADGNHWGEAVTLLETTSATPYLLQLPPRRPRQLHRHRPVGLGQDGGAELPRRPGAEVRPAHDLLRQGPRRRAVHRAASAAATTGSAPGRADRLQPAAAARQRRQPRLPARLAGRAARAPRARRSWRRSPARSTRLTPTMPRCAACATSASCSAARAGPQPGDLAVAPRARGSSDGEHAWLFDNADDQLDLDRADARLRHDRAARRSRACARRR